MSAAPPESPLARALQALPIIEQALARDAQNPRLHLQHAQCLLTLGRKDDAVGAAMLALGQAPADVAFFDALGGVFSFADAQDRALAAYDRAVKLAPDDPRPLFNRATVLRFVGRLDEAEADYDRVIALKPDDFEAYKNRSDLRRQTPLRNHLAELGAVLATAPDWRAAVQLRYALAKEHEDLGNYAQSFAELEQGSRLRRAHLRYDVATDVATVDWIIAAFPGDPGDSALAARDPAARDPAARAPCDAPIFVLGLPRSGTTLVDRILGSHSQLFSAGELNDFALALVAAVVRRDGGTPLPRRELVARSASLDFAALGRDYIARSLRIPGRPEASRLIDKMPLNYLYCGPIARALPYAKIVHLVRHPMAACYAMYKTLFRDGYPFSYDLSEIARYYAAYRRLMDHWEGTLPGRIHTLHYEALVANPDLETRRLLAFCGLEWEESCASFHFNPAPTTTASAAQVREPVHDRSVAQWRRYERQLAGLYEQLKIAGITGLDADAPLPQSDAT
jgi:tetratricopeptide (TPR) repeat protein